MFFKKRRAQALVNRAIEMIPEICEEDCPKGVERDAVWGLCYMRLETWHESDRVSWNEYIIDLHSQNYPIREVALELMHKSWEDLSSPNNYETHEIPDSAKPLIAALDSIIQKNIARLVDANVKKSIPPELRAAYDQFEADDLDQEKKFSENTQSQVLQLIDKHASSETDTPELKKLFFDLTKHFDETGAIGITNIIRLYFEKEMPSERAAISLIDGLVGTIKKTKDTDPQFPLNSAKANYLIQSFEDIIDSYADPVPGPDSYIPHNGKVAKRLMDNGLDKYFTKG